MESKLQKDTNNDNSSKNLEDKILNKINELKIEAQNHVNMRAEIERSQRDIDIRLTQIAGAINELEKLITPLK